MSRTLPTGLAAKITAANQQPELAVTVQDLTTKLSLFSSGGSSGRSSAILSSTGKVLRAVVGQAASSNQTIKVQRITPTTSTDWSAAGVTVVSAAAQAAAGCCIVQTGS